MTFCFIVIFGIVLTLINSHSISTRHTIKPKLDHIQDDVKILSNCPGEENFCDSVKNYPEDLINNLLKENNVLVKEYFNKTLNPIITSRDNIDPTFTNMCNVLKIVKWPKIGKNTNNITRFIINTDEYQQSITMKYCGRSKNCECNKIKIPGYSVKCIQEKLKVKLIVLDEGPSFGIEEFNVFGGCSCAYQSENYTL